jgi:hypothetical protein
MTAALTDTCFAGCIADHDQDPGLHYTADTTVEDLDGHQLGVALFHRPDTGRTGVYLGDYEVSLCTALRIAGLLQDAARVGADIPGVLEAELAAGAR